ncbi:MAG: hypothetical protein R3E02_08980 [Blastomonas sp.]
MFCLPDSFARRVVPALARSAAVLLLVSPVAAWAVYPQKVELAGPGAEEIPTGNISFEPSDGSTVTVRDDDDDDDGGFALIFPGDRPVPGTLVVRLPDGSVARIPVPAAGPGDKIVVDLPRRTAMAVPDRSPRPSAPGDSPGIGLTLMGGVMDKEAPPVGAGTLIDGGTEDFAAVTDDKLTVPFGGMGISFPAGSGKLMIFGGYGKGDDKAANSTAAGGAIDVGIVFTDFAPSGSTGLFLGNAGLDTMVDRKVKISQFGGIYTLPVNEYESLERSLNARFGFRWQHMTQQVDAQVTSPTFGNSISSTYDQRVKEDLFTFSLGAEYADRPDRGFQFAVGGDALLIHRDAGLRSRQVNICTVCGAQDQNFTIAIDDNDKGVTFGLRGSMSAGIGLGGGLSIGVSGFVEYRNKVSQIANPRTGDDLFVRNQPTAIRTQSATDVGGFIFLQIGI